MTLVPTLAEIAALIGNPARANMLVALLDGRALTAGELAYAASLSPQTTSGHLAQMTEAGLMSVIRQGRFSYFRLATPRVGQLLENLLAVAAERSAVRPLPRRKGEEALRLARTCYDHLAGRLGVAVTEALIASGRVTLSEDGGQMTPDGMRFLENFGVDLVAAGKSRRTFCRPCLDWSERRLHLAGAVGAGIATRCLDLGWVERMRDGRALTVTGAGLRGLTEAFGLPERWTQEGA